MKRIFQFIVVFSFIFLLIGCTKENELNFEKSTLTFDWINECKSFTGYQFKDGIQMYIVYNDEPSTSLYCYDQGNNKLWEKNNFVNMKVIDVYEDGLLIQSDSVLRIGLDGSVLWSLPYPGLSKISEDNNGVIYVSQFLYTKKSLIKISNKGELEWEKGPFTSIKNVSFENNKIVLSFNNNDDLVMILDQSGNELLTFEEIINNKYFTSENYIYLYTTNDKILKKYDNLGNLICQNNDVQIYKYLFEFEDELYVMAKDGINKIGQNGIIPLNIWEIRVWLTNYQFFTSFNDGSFLIYKDITIDNSVYIKYDKNGKVLFKEFFKNLKFIKTLDNENMLFECKDYYSEEKSLYLFDSSFHLIYQTETYSKLDLFNSLDNLKYVYKKDNIDGFISISKEGRIYITRREESNEKLLLVDQFGDQKYLFNIISINENETEKVIDMFIIDDNKFLIYVLVENKLKLKYVDLKNNEELFGDYLGLVINGDEKIYYIQKEEELIKLKI